MIDTDSPNFLRRVLFADAATCVATGALLTLGASTLSGVLGLPPALLFYAGLSLFPIAAFIAFVASQAALPATGIWLIIIGNAAWIVASLALLVDQRVTPSYLGIAFVLGQAVAVGILAELEYTGLRRVRHRIA